MSPKLPPVAYADLTLLRALYTYRYLTAAQLCRLHYSLNSITHAQEKMLKLFKRGYCGRFKKDRIPPHGAEPWVYYLERPGFNELVANQLVEPERFRTDSGPPSPHNLKHTLAINDFLISAELLTKGHPEIEIEQVVGEKDCQRRATKVQIVAENRTQSMTVTPDSWLHMSTPSGQHFIALEVDRGSESVAAFRQHLRGRLAWLQGPYQEAFKTEAVVIAYLVSGPDKRLAKVKKWIEAELKDLHQAYRDLFIISSIDPAVETPEAVFLQPKWLMPYGTAYVSLITVQ